MDLNHLHLHVQDLERSRTFYASYFGFREHTRHGKILFMRNERAFDLALAPDAEKQGFPTWFHFGFRLQNPTDVRDLHARMKTAGVAMKVDLIDDEGYVSFRCFDPDGHGIEIYWE
jgi:catechol 2,3-dioxygenase-like lactoylglutathione lyase family enzyme